jgi:uncharacterized membrane protein YfcA
MTWVSFPLVFAAMTALDFVFAEYTRATADRHAIKASLWASTIIVLTGFVTTSYVENHWLMIPAAIGAFAGTWLSVRRA